MKGSPGLKAFGLATSYIFGMGVMYATLGVVVTLLGQQFGSFLANPFVVIPLVIIFAALAMSMFGAFEIRLPRLAAGQAQSGRRQGLRRRVRHGSGRRPGRGPRAPGLSWP